MQRRALLAGGGALLAGAGPGDADGRAGTLRYVTGGAVNTLDPVAQGATGEATALSMATYDRLFRFGRVPAGDGVFVFDGGLIEGELAEGFSTSPDGCSIVVRLRGGAAWHDGAPVTAEDVKWSFDRAVQAGTMAKAQLATGSLTEAGQMEVLDRGSVAIRLPRPDRLALPNLATAFAPMFNSRLARQHATEGDPWALGWLKENAAGGGAYTVERLEPGQRVELRRNQAWVNGARPGFGRAIVQTVPEAATRAVLVERGDADLATGLAPQDLRHLAGAPGVRVVSTPMPTGFGALAFNARMAPFDAVGVRRALAAAVPYEAIFRAAADGRGVRLFGAGWVGEPPGTGFPQAMPLRTDLAAAARGLATAGLAGGFETTLTYGVSRAGFADVSAALIQEAFGKVGVRVRIEALADAPLAQAMTEKRLPMLLERSLALFPSTEYFFRIFANGASRWNFANWRDPVVEDLLTRAPEAGGAKAYEEIDRQLVGRMADQVPMAMLWQPADDLAMAGDLAGFTTTPTYHPDVRDLRRG